jgi:hypothetical protein
MTAIGKPGREIDLLLAIDHPLQAPRDDTLHDGVHDGFLARKVSVDLSDTHLGLGGDLAHAGGVETVTDHAGTRRGNYLVPPELVT